MKICPNKKKNLQLEAIPGILARVAPASFEAGAIDINFDTAKRLPKTSVASPQNSSGTMGRGDAAKTRGNKETTPKSRPKAPAKARPTAAPVVTPAKPTRSSPRGRTAADGELDRIAAMNRANAEEKRARGTDEAGKGGGASAKAPGDAAAAVTTAAGSGATKEGGDDRGSGDGRGSNGMEVEAAATAGEDEDPPSQARKRRATGARAEALRDALMAAGAKPVEVTPASSLRPAELKHNNVRVRGQITLSSDKPVDEFLRFIPAMLGEMQKTSAMTRLEAVVRGGGSWPCPCHRRFPTTSRSSSAMWI